MGSALQKALKRVLTRSVVQWALEGGRVLRRVLGRGPENGLVDEGTSWLLSTLPSSFC